MIHPRPGPIGLNSINTIETKVLMETATEKTRRIKAAESKDLNLRPRTKEEERKAESPEEAANLVSSELMLALQIIQSLKVPPLLLEENAGGTIDYVA